ncbi:hypothetical protein COCSUDRAFT_66158 [Coccomyxa subellipsoidea C-169]|uniref:Uncharacterized protein n=1 Tax=Coccomyxa subellipsoidea (strain C-169) TaxID=574566 RepID=I0YXG2_COCSC|nr:hypothetical protein COCSUDRAFT_66158 [Coccomyxa subellipsoidea C-169]EIE23081.1 hypothetical protein COCSUDRAFT_66158 [Coccomyxa subellipsoidea C-169]|eukprot:XP_005647625.1 hypothetical protein COCSUDRAFT_66158 [Coccomyxa subellipsoidea C-169]
MDLLCLGPRHTCLQGMTWQHMTWQRGAEQQKHQHGRPATPPHQQPRPQRGAATQQCRRALRIHIGRSHTARARTALRWKPSWQRLPSAQPSWSWRSWRRRKNTSERRLNSRMALLRSYCRGATLRLTDECSGCYRSGHVCVYILSDSIAAQL